MAEPYIGEIRMFAGNFAPADWMFCDGQLLPISENEALFALIGTTYGGDGQTTFALPDLRGRVPVHQAAALGTRTIGETGGVENVTLTIAQMPAHSHAMRASSAVANLATPQNNVTGQAAAKLYRGGSPSVSLPPQSLAVAGGVQPHENFQPYLCVSFIIAVFGIFPSQA
jgi:microcystin-dependent protein